MASIGHVAIGMACGRAYGTEPRTMRRAMVALSAISLLPDIDSLAFVFGIPYEHSLGHRGFTHSFVFAALVTLASYVYAQRKALPAKRVAIVTAIVAVSHPLLDTMTYGGGLGCALLWPISDARYWAPFRLIPIAPIGPYLFSKRGLLVMATELVLFAPFILFALIPRKKRETS